jgi:hypothetical protein
MNRRNLEERANSVTSDPAFSISVSEGTPNRSLVTRSISRISAEVTIFIINSIIAPNAELCPLTGEDARPSTGST